MRISDWSSDVCSSDLLRGHAQLGRLQALDLVADARRVLELQVGGGRLHARLQLLDDLVDRLVDQVAFLGAGVDGDVVAALVHAGERSEKRRVEKECCRTCRSGGAPYR